MPVFFHLSTINGGVSILSLLYLPLSNSVCIGLKNVTSIAVYE